MLNKLQYFILNHLYSQNWTLNEKEINRVKELLYLLFKQKLDKERNCLVISSDLEDYLDHEYILLGSNYVSIRIRKSENSKWIYLNIPFNKGKLITGKCDDFNFSYKFSFSIDDIEEIEPFIRKLLGFKINE